MPMNDDATPYLREVSNTPPYSPVDILKLLLSLIEPDGSVRLCYDPNNPDMEWETVPPHQPLPLSDFAEQVYAARLLRVARLLFQLCQQMNSQELPSSDLSLRSAAVQLTAYQHDSVFLYKALALITLDEHGRPTRPPRLSYDYTASAGNRSGICSVS